MAMMHDEASFSDGSLAPPEPINYFTCLLSN